MPTVFSHIIQKRFSRVNEDVATDALAYILESSEAARRGIQNLIHAVSPDMPDLTFKTQQTEGSIRPDMWGFSNSEPRVYIENKFWAGLTDNQPVAYLRQLEVYGSPSVLLVIAPEARQHTLWRELLIRLRNEGITTDYTASRSGIAHIAKTSTGPVMALTSWNTVLSMMETQAADDPAARSDISQLRALCQAADSEAFLPLSGEVLTDQRTPHFMLQLSDLVQNVADVAVSRGVLYHGGTRPQNSTERIGRYTYFGEDRRSGGWLGIHFRLWRTYGRTPLWMVVYTSSFKYPSVIQEVLDPWAAKNGVFTTRDEKGDYVIALDIPAGEEKDSVVNSIVIQLEAMYHQMPVPDQTTIGEPDLPEADHE